MRVAGIDAGLKGSAALLVKGKLTELIDLPTMDGELDALSLFNTLIEWEPDYALTEQTFIGKKILQFTAEVKAIFKIMQIKYDIVDVVTWKQAVLGVNTKDKKVSIKKCQELYPEANLIRGKVANADRAEAILLAHYGLNLYGKKK